MATSRKRSRSSRPLRGTYTGHSRGFGFFVPDRGGDDLFVPPGKEGHAVDGDSVEVQPAGGDTVRVVRVIRRGRRLMAGTYYDEGRFLPDSHRIGKPLPVEGKADKGDKILATATPEGFRIARILGRAGSHDVEDAAVLAELDIEGDFPPEALAEVDACSPPAGDVLKGRSDLRSALTIVTIDPSTSRDFDDAVSVERQGADWVLGVHIADVSHYVRPGTAIDAEARRRGTSVYLPSQVIPMLPERLSNDLCSLREGSDRLALSVQLTYDPKGTLKRARVMRSVIRPCRRFSYERASRVMDGTRRERGAAGKALANMAELAALLRTRRESLEIPRDETEFVYDAVGHVVDLRSIAKDMAHGVIEEFMLAANRAVARLLLDRRVPSLFRHHPEPDDLATVWQTLRLLEGDALPDRLGEAVALAARNGHGPAAAAAVFRAMSRAVYTTRTSSHFTLAFDAYCHFTSPIRRYADLLVHRAVHNLLAESKGSIGLPVGAAIRTPVEDADLEALAERLNERAAAAERAETRIRRRRVLEFLLRQGALPTCGQIVAVLEKGLIVQLGEYGISGFLGVDALPGDGYSFADGQLSSGNRHYRLGRDIDVIVHRIDPTLGQLDLAPAPTYG